MKCNAAEYNKFIVDIIRNGEKLPIYCDCLIALILPYYPVRPSSVVARS